MRRIVSAIWIRIRELTEIAKKGYVCQIDKTTCRSRTLASIQRELIRLFVIGMQSRNVVNLSGVSRNAAILS